jgi:hypothetical protein
VNGSKERDFRHILVEDTYVVWLSGANRFLQLKEPAFFVFEAWARAMESEAIARECAVRYELPVEEALRFTSEIISETEKIFFIQHKDTKARRKFCGSPRLNSTVLTQRSAKEAQNTAEKTLMPQTFENHTPFSYFNCLILGKIIRFNYSDPELEALFRPLFRQFETEKKGMVHGAWCMVHGAQGPPPTPDSQIEMPGPEQNRTYGDQNDWQEVEVDKGNRIDFFQIDGNYAFRVNAQETQISGANDIEHFQGAVLMEVLNLLYGKTRDDWMGIFHASAVSDRKEALLFVAASGSGKSTLAALMVAHGYQLLSDDFVPVSLDSTEVFPLPAAISVKKNAIPFLKDFFPSLSEQEEETSENTNREVFLPLEEGSLASSPVKAKAIVFVQYDPSVDFRLSRESNLTAMNNLLKQSWINNNSTAAERFLSWYFSLPVYSMVYSDSEKAVSAMMKLM